MLKVLFTAFEIMVLIIDQTFQRGTHKCDTLITLVVSSGVGGKKKKQAE